MITYFYFSYPLYTLSFVQSFGKYETVIQKKIVYRVFNIWWNEQSGIKYYVLFCYNFVISIDKLSKLNLCINFYLRTYNGNEWVYGKVVKSERPRNYQIQTNTVIVRRQIWPIIIKTEESVVRKSLNNEWHRCTRRCNVSLIFQNKEIPILALMKYLKKTVKSLVTLQALWCSCREVKPPTKLNYQRRIYLARGNIE